MNELLLSLQNLVTHSDKTRSQLAVCGAYSTVLGRSPDQAGLKIYTDQLLAGRELQDVWTELAQSAEFGREMGRELQKRGRERVIEQYYRILLGRKIDPDGRKVYLQGNYQLEVVLSDILKSTEYGRRFRTDPTQNTVLFWPFQREESPFSDKAAPDTVKRAYQKLLKRNPDQQGQSHYVNQLRTGRELEEIWQDIARSSEFQDQIAKVEARKGKGGAVNELYHRVLNRGVDGRGRQSYVTSGVPTHTVLESVLASREFKNKFRQDPSNPKKPTLIIPPVLVLLP